LIPELGTISRIPQFCDLKVQEMRSPPLWSASSFLLIKTAPTTSLSLLSMQGKAPKMKMIVPSSRVQSDECKRRMTL